MGSQGSKRRAKTKHSQHLPKVGTKTENERLLHDERQAVMDSVGLGRAPFWVKAVVVVIVVALLASAVLGLIILD